MKTVICWFRKCLRLHDNPALLTAIETAQSNRSRMCPLFILDPYFIKKYKKSSVRWRFLFEALDDLDNSLKNIGSRLYVLQDGYQGLELLIKKWDVSHILYEEDFEPFSIVRDEWVRGICSINKVVITTFKSYSIFDHSIIVSGNRGAPPLRYKNFVSMCGKPRLPLGPPPRIDAKLYKKVAGFRLPRFSDFWSHLNEMESGIRKSIVFRGGEGPGLELLHSLDPGLVKNFSKPNTDPMLLDRISTTGMSPYLKFGCISAKLVLHYISGMQTDTTYPVSLRAQLYWREFFYCAAANVPNFDRMVGNPICRQIDWNCKERLFRAWERGETGYPVIDAMMTQLRLEGWIHHLARHVVACFLTRGNLHCSWERGAAVFEELLVDADWALNTANWLWVSGSAFFYRTYRVYSPTSFGRKRDPNGLYIKRYIPALKNVPPKFVYEPWLMNKKQQKECCCVIGKDYPKRIV